jgi:hypothetical protein
VNKRDLSAFQDAAPEEEAPNPKVQRQKRAFVLNENGEPADGSCWSPIPDWVACRLNAAGAYGSTIALALAIARLVRQRSGENPTSLYERRPAALACAPRGHTRARALRQLEAIGVARRVGGGQGRASVVLALWLPRK